MSITNTKTELSEAIQSAGETELDICWSVLTNQRIGIYRKVKGFCKALNLEFDDVVDDLPKDDEMPDRLLDSATRHILHSALKKASRNHVDEYSGFE